MNIKHYKKSLVGIVTAVLLVFLPFVVSRHLFYGAINAKYFFAVSFMSLAFLVYAYFLISKQHTIVLRRRWLLGSFVVGLGVMYLSSFFGVFFEGSLWSDILRSSGVLFLSYVTLFSFVISELLTARDWSFIRRAVAFSSGIFAFLTYFGADGLGFTGRLFTINFELQGLTFNNTTFAGAYLLIALLVTLIEWTRSEKKSRAWYTFGTLAIVQMLSPLLFGERMWRGVQGVTGLFADPANILGAARASSATMFLILLCCLGLVLIRRFVGEQYRARVSWVWGGVLLAVTMSAVIFLFVPGSTIQEKYVEQASSARIIVWEEGFRAFAERPLLGWGPENFRIAHTQHFDNRLYIKENLGEVWFDRAHNIVVDTLVTVGILGALSILLVVGLFLRTVFRAHRAGLIAYGEACLLAVLPFAHFLQLQTAFDTIGTYVLLGVIGGYVMWLEYEMVTSTSSSTVSPQDSFLIGRVAGGVFVCIGVLGLWFLVGKEYGRQQALFQIFNTTNTQEQLVYAKKALSRTSNFEGMRLASASLISGSFDFIPKTEPEKQASLIASVVSQLDMYGSVYKEYLDVVPSDYRARMNYAYLLMVETTYGKNRLDEARQQVELARPLSPGNPLTNVMDALVALYGGKVAEARQIMKDSIIANPDIPLSQEVADYIEKQAKQFPVISILKMGNI